MIRILVLVTGNRWRRYLYGGRNDCARYVRSRRGNSRKPFSRAGGRSDPREEMRVSLY